jgi:glucans biosynthesis protein
MKSARIGSQSRSNVLEPGELIDTCFDTLIPSGPATAMRVKPDPSSPPPVGGIDRRSLLATGLALPATLLSDRLMAQSQPVAGVAEGQKFSAAAVIDYARALAKKPFAAPSADLPDPFGNLSYEQYVAIRALPAAVLWDNEQRGFTVEPLHRGFAFQAPVTLYVVEDETVRRVSYDRAKFDYGKLNVPPALPDLGFSGLRIFGDAQNGTMREVGIFQGATFYRSSARGQNLGIMARGLTLKLGDPKGEEFPAFRAFWVERPGPLAEMLVIHALLDSESATGAYRFTLRPGDVTIIDTEMTLFPRVPVDNYGIGGMTTTFLFGPNSRRGVDDLRPAVYENGGLQIKNGNDEWIWRPFQNPEALQISAFVDPSPRGYGFLQRERDYAAFRDDDQHFERRPTLWNEPIGDWAAGNVQLFEIPTDNEINDNIIGFWRPKQPLQPGVETSFAYRQFWCWQPPERPATTIVSATRTGKGGGGRRRRFIVDFTGDMLKDPQAFQDLKPMLTSSPGALGNLRQWNYPERRLCRVGFELDPGNENACELRLVLESGGKPASETWLYRWTP